MPKKPAMSSVYQRFAALLLLFTANITESPKSRTKQPSPFFCCCFFLYSETLEGSQRPRHRQASPVVSSGAASEIQDRQLESPLSTVDSSEGVGPKAARTLGSVELGYKVPPLLLHLCSLLDEPFDLNQNLMSQLTGLTRMDGNDECTILVKAS